MTGFDDAVHLQRAQHRVVQEVQSDVNGVRAVHHHRVERGERHERDRENVSQNVD